MTGSPLTPLADAIHGILAEVGLLPVETVALSEAMGRVLAEPVVAGMALPPFDNSAMDGYAVRAGDVAGARPDAPVRLRVAGQLAAGEWAGGVLEPGTCFRVFTGSALPGGADAVVMQEETRRAPEAPGEVAVHERVRTGENIRRRGDDVRAGAEVLSAGERLTAAGVSLMAALGLREAAVSRRPLVALLATGSELVEAGVPLPPGGIYESNRVGLGGLLRAIGVEPRVLPLVADHADATRAALEAALQSSDAVISTGGVSVGDTDLVKSAFESLGGRLSLWRVAIRPGKPFAFGTWRGKRFFGLPGNPVSALVTFLLLVRPALLRLQGARDLELPAHPGVLAESLANPGDRRHFMRVQVNACGEVRSAGGQGSHQLSGLARANGLVDVPPGTTLPAGAPVSVLRWEGA